MTEQGIGEAVNITREARSGGETSHEEKQWNDSNIGIGN